MGMAAHVDLLAEESVTGVVGMERVDLGVFGAVEIIEIVALDGLVEKGQAHEENEQRNEEELPAQLHTITHGQSERWVRPAS